MRIKSYIENNWFWIFLIIVIFFGYSVGKDIALHDNAKEQTISQPYKGR